LLRAPGRVTLCRSFAPGVVRPQRVTLYLGADVLSGTCSAPPHRWRVCAIDVIDKRDVLCVFITAGPSTMLFVEVGCVTCSKNCTEALGQAKCSGNFLPNPGKPSLILTAPGTLWVQWEWCFYFSCSTEERVCDVLPWLHGRLVTDARRAIFTGPQATCGLRRSIRLDLCSKVWEGLILRALRSISRWARQA
jgi:hypothetical protein